MSSNDHNAQMKKLLQELNTLLKPESKEEDSKFDSIAVIKNAWDSFDNIDVQGLTAAQKINKYWNVRFQKFNTIEKALQDIAALSVNHPREEHIQKLLDLIFKQFAYRLARSSSTKETSEEDMPKRSTPKP